MSVFVSKDSELANELELDSKSVGEAAAWIDDHLEGLRLKPSSDIELPYGLPDDVADVSVFDVKDQEAALATLAEWFAFANQILTGFVSRHADIAPGPSPLRCWPHHFDLATYVSLETGDAETARGIGVGLSPGDESYDQPYFYVNPWPHLSQDELPNLPSPGHWHKQGFVGAIATGEAILGKAEVDNLTNYIDGAFALGRERLFAVGCS